MKHMKTHILTVIVVSMVLVACGYRFSPGGEHIDKNIRTVFVGNLTNLTSEANLENYVRGAFITQFRKVYRFELAESRDRADALITGSVTRLNISHASYKTTEVAAEDRVTVTLDVTFKKRKTNEIIWRDRNFTGRRTFVVADNTNVTERNKKDALRELADEMAKRAYRSIMSDF